PRIATTGTGGGFFLGDSQLGYRVLFSRKDENDFTIRGAPSLVAVTLANPKFEGSFTASGTTVTVTLEGHGFTEGDLVSITSEDADTLDGSYQIWNVTEDTFESTADSEPNPTSGDLIVWKDYDVEITVPLPDDVVAGDFLEIYRSTLSADAT